MNAADSACSGWPSTKIWNSPQPSIAKTPIMNAYVGKANAVPDSRMPRRLAAATNTTVPTANTTLWSAMNGIAEPMLAIPAEIETATVRT